MSYQGANTGRLFAASVLSLVFVLTCVVSANGQVTVGDNLNMNLRGDLGTTYGGTSGNYVGSNHSLGIGVNGILDGYYFHPDFLRFKVNPFWDRAQSNSISQTIARSTGVQGSVNLFDRSHFPGSVSYGKNFSSNSEFSIAGVPSVLGDSSDSSIGIAWGALFDGLPSLHAEYTVGHSTSTLLGTTSQSKNSNRSFNLDSDYTLAGFDLRGRLSHYNYDLLSPGFLTGETISGALSSTVYNVNVGHRLPFSGNLGLGWSRTTSKYATNDSASNSYLASAGFFFWRRLSFNQNLRYTTALNSALTPSFNGDDIPTLFNSDSESNALYMNTSSTFAIGSGFSVNGYLTHQTLHFRDRNYENTQYGGNVSFRKSSPLLGFLHFSIGVVDTVTKEGNTALGISANLGMTRKFGRWETNADIGYGQSTQTLYGLVTTSNYSFGGNFRRRINYDTFWSTSFRESRSGLTAQEGNNNDSKVFSTALAWKKYTFTGNYSQSNGEALLRADGTLTVTPLGSIVSDDFMTFDARSFGASVGTLLFRKITVSAGYTNVSSSTIRRALGTLNNGDRFNTRVELRLRKLNISGGFNRAVQEVSSVPGGPRMINSYYMSLSRWFEIF